MLQLKEGARPGLGGDGRAGRHGGVGAPPFDNYHSTGTGVCVVWAKRGKECILGKLVVARPIGQTVFAMPFRNRQAVQHVSVPPQVLAYVRRAGALWWIVRMDGAGTCFGLPLSEVEQMGWLATSEGQPEWFIPLSLFEPIPWQTWPYVEATVSLGPDLPPEPPEALQLPLPLGAAP